MKILENSNVLFEIVNYLNVPPTISELKKISKKLGLQPKEFIRKSESIFKNLDLQSNLNNEELLFKCISENPKLLERPIVVKGNKAIIGRPPENILNLIS